MIPYFQFETIYLGPIPIRVWGLMVALGILAALLVAGRMAEKQGLDKNKIWDAGLGVLIFAFVGARLFHVFGYSWEIYSQNFLDIFKVWQGGFSSTGGIVGALLYLGYFVRRHKLDFWKFADVAAFSFPLGYGIGRIGCFLIHDHPGTLSDFILAVRYPGGARHDLGLYLSISGFSMFLIFLLVKKFYKNPPKGFYASVGFLWYGLSRFFLDFLRALDLPVSDARYAGLTVAQYFGIVLVMIGIYYLYKIYGRRAVQT